MNISKLNISILCTSLASGGAQKVISLLLKKLKDDYNVTLVLFHQPIHFPIPEEVKVVVLTTNSGKISAFQKIFDPLLYLKRYNSILNKENISISISFLAYPNFINGVAAILNKNIKTIISERGFPSDNTSSKTSYYISKLFYPILYNRCSRLFSNSIYINEDLKNNFAIHIPMEVIYNPIELPLKKIDPKHLNNNNPLKIITAGTLNTRKNQIMIIRAFNEIKNNDNLTILGEGHLRNYLATEIKNFKLEQQISLEGEVKNVNTYFLKSNCFVLSSFTEGFPNALMEAMAVGLPCISSNCLSGPLELLNDNSSIQIKKGDFFKGKNGLLVNNDDYIGLSKAIDFFRKNPAEREKYSALSLIKAQEYQLDNIYSKFNKFIKD